ncbi:MAG: dTDP-4-dehydrorhamnose reductase [Verrucomicrobia bacterium]|nr:dTDP-4-dehydrorhamnose reductase [Verrucomicrobiota bacterium]
MKRVVIVGKRGRLGAALVRELAPNCQVVGLGREDLDLSKPVGAQIAGLEFDLLINCAAATNVDWCEQNPDLAERINAAAVGELAEVCRRRHARLVHLSTDYVFDGRAQTPLSEQVPPNPANRYGLSKRHGELAALAGSGEHLVIRVSWVFGPDRPSFIDQLIGQAQRQSSVAAVADKWSAPTYTLDFCRWLQPALFEQPIGGILHVCNAGACSWREWAEATLDAARQLGLPVKANSVEPLALAEMKKFTAARPVYTVMDTARFQALTGIKPRPWQEAVRDYVRRHYRVA